MTEPTYSINSGTQIHGVAAAWDNAPVQPQDNGQMAFSPWLRHVWQADKMPQATWLELRAAQGEALTTIETNDYDYPNEAQIYTSVILEAITGRHVGHIVRDVTADFRIADDSRTLGAFDTGFSHGFKT